MQLYFSAHLCVIDTGVHFWNFFFSTRRCRIYFAWYKAVVMLKFKTDISSPCLAALFSLLRKTQIIWVWAQIQTTVLERTIVLYFCICGRQKLKGWMAGKGSKPRIQSRKETNPGRARQKFKISLTNRKQHWKKWGNIWKISERRHKDGDLTNEKEVKEGGDNRAQVKHMT